jgi:hypothetical protein
MIRRPALLLSCFVLAASWTTAGCESSPEPAPRSSTAGLEPGADRFTTVWVGDILLADAFVKKKVRKKKADYYYPFEKLREELTADYVVGNQEGPITAVTKRYWPKQKWHYNAVPETAKVLKDVGFDALSLANNHLLDRGPDGVEASRTHIAAAGMVPFGGGKDHATAIEPLIVETPHGKLGVVGFGRNWRKQYKAEPDRAGLPPLSRDNLAEGLQLARAAGAKWVVAYPHWGKNYKPANKSQEKWGRRAIEAGYDAVIGHGSHMAQRVDIVDGKPVVYSLGNFVFGTPGRYSEEFPGWGLMLRTYLGPDGFDGFELTCILTDNKKIDFQPRPCPADSARAFFAQLGEGKNLEVREGGKAVVTW